MGRLESFSADDEAAHTLRQLGYSEDEIGATAGQLESSLGTEERLRLSLRALSSEHSTQRQEKAEATAPPYNPKVYPEAGGADPSVTHPDEYMRKLKEQNKPPKGYRAPRQVDPVRQSVANYRKLSRLARKARGRRR